MASPAIARANKRSGRVARALAMLLLRACGWRVEGSLPPGTKAVVIAAPHTSNWDMPFMLAVGYLLGIRPSWTGKREIFRWPFAGFMRWLGGIPITRGERRNVVEQVSAAFDAVDQLYLVIPPSGTRRRSSHWKSGFYRIAHAARVPIVCSFLDYRRKVGGVGLVLEPTGDIRADMAVLREFYATVTGRFPDLTTPVRLLEEDEPTTQTSAGR